MAFLARPVSRTPFLLAALAGLLSLAVAYISQYGFGLHPCELCMLQRLPYALIILLGFATAALKRRPVWLLGLIALLFLADGGIATYHALVEKHWIPGPTACTASDTEPSGSVDDFLSRIKQAPIVACDAPQWEFHGITMAALNALWAYALALACGRWILQLHKRGKTDARTAG